MRSTKAAWFGRRSGGRRRPQGAAAIAAIAAIAASPAGAAPAAPAAPAATAAAVPPVRAPGWAEGATPTVPAGFRVLAFARGLEGPRSVLVLPNRDVLVAEAGAAANRISLLRDADRDGVAETRTTLLDGVRQPHGLAIRRDRLYVGVADGVLSCPFFVGQTRITGPCRTILPLPAEEGDAPPARSLVLSPDESQLYVAAGAAIRVAKPDGSGVQVFASGLASALGLAFEPVTGRLWTAVGGREVPGDAQPSDYLAAVRPGGVQSPDVALGAHGAPLGLAFYRRANFPARYRGGAFVAQRGATSAAPRVAFVPFAKGRPAGDAEDFVGGFVSEAPAGALRGRPAAIAVTKDGALLIADDAGNVVWRVETTCKACQGEI